MIRDVGSGLEDAEVADTTGLGTGNLNFSKASFSAAAGDTPLLRAPPSNL
jgi:hypothetical protein